MKKPTKEVAIEDKFGEAQDKLYRYIDWLEDTGRLTTEEHTKLLDIATDCIMKAVSFGWVE